MHQRPARWSSPESNHVLARWSWGWPVAPCVVPARPSSRHCETLTTPPDMRVVRAHQPANCAQPHSSGRQTPSGSPLPQPSDSHHVQRLPLRVQSAHRRRQRARRNDDQLLLAATCAGSPDCRRTNSGNAGTPLWRCARDLHRTRVCVRERGIRRVAGAFRQFPTE